MNISMTREFPFLIDGQYFSSGAPVEIRSPFSGEVVGVTYQATPADVERAIAAASRAFDAARHLPTHRRAEILDKIVRAIQANHEDMARLIALESGKPIRTARAEVARAVLTFTDGLEESKRIRGEWLPLDLDPSSAGRSAIVRRFPVGPVAAITPFNFPVNLVAHKLAPALACGTSVVLKPAPQAPLSALNLARIISEAGWPAGALNAFACSNDAAQPLISDDRLKVLSFTGSAAVGWALKQKAGKKRVLLELGGNAAVAIHSDADLDFAAERCVMGGFTYSGQSCVSVQRIFVHRPVFDAFLDKLLPRVSQLELGDPLDETTDLGPMISPAAAERAARWIQDAVRSGAQLLAGGERDGSFLQPTVLTNTRADMSVCCEEAFAPLVTVDPYDDLPSALAAINNSPYGLQAGLFTRDLDAVFRAFDSLDVGGLMINDVPTYRADSMPYGGWKDSGLGREGVRFAIDELTDLKSVVLNIRP